MIYLESSKHLFITPSSLCSFPNSIYSVLISTVVLNSSVVHTAGNSRYDAMIKAKVTKAATRCFLFVDMVVICRVPAYTPREIMCQLGIYSHSCPKNAISR